ncbi:MAG: hypothetical protein ACJ8I9_08285 [Chthoniobacterales bacterium]
MMKVQITFFLISVASLAFAQEAATNNSPPASSAEVEQLRQQVQSLTELVKQLQQQVQNQPQPQANPAASPMLPENPEPQSTPAEAAASPSKPTNAPQLIPTEDASVVANAPAAPPTPGGVNANGAATIPTEDTSVVASDTTISSTGTGGALTQPMTIASGAGGKNYMNLSFDNVASLAYSSARDLYNVEVGDHDPQQRGFNERNAELALDGAVDPYFEGFANIVFKLDNDNETSVELEEAFLQTTNLPWGLQAKGGQFFAPFGRLNPTHPHTWDFADAPLVEGLFLGSDGLRGVGGQLAWTLPTPWYAQLYLAVQNGRGNTGFSFRNPGDNGMFFGRLTTDREMRGLQDFLWQPRFETSFNLSDTQTILGGVSAAFGSNETGANSKTQIYGADLLYKWKSAHAEGGFPFVKWQTEAMYRKFEAGRGIDETFPVAETFDDWGVYSQIVWGFRKGWTAGLRGDYVHMDDSDYTVDIDRQTRSRISANITWYPTEFSKLRLQYSHDWLEEMSGLTFLFPGREVDSVFFQFEFILGAHGAHKF